MWQRGMLWELKPIHHAAGYPRSTGPARRRNYPTDLVSRHRNEFHRGVRSNGYQSNAARGAGALTNVQRFKVTGH